MGIDVVAVFSQPLLVWAQFLISMLMYCWRQPRRENFSLRLGLVVAGTVAFTLVASYVGFVGEPRLMGEWSFVTQMVLFGLLPFVMALLASFCFDVPPWTSVFLTVAAFSTQNIAMGFLGMFYVIIGGLGVVADVESEVIALYPVSVDLLNLVTCILFTAVSYAVCWRLFASKLEREWKTRPQDWTIAAIFVAVILVEIVFDMSMKSTYNYGLPVFQRAVFGMTKLFICFFLLYSEFQLLYVGSLRHDMAISDRLLRERVRQYEVSQATIEAINVKCHDIRHQIRHFGDGGQGVDREILKDIAHEVKIYAAGVRTGNAALDTILTEKSLACQNLGITLSCIADGHALDFMPDAEIYSLFGNVLDNAMEAAGHQGEGKRCVSLVVQRRGGMVSIHEENYFAGELSLSDGLPQTTKDDKANHGFGMLSIRSLAEHHGGTLTVRAEGELFLLDVLLPLE